MRWKGIKPGGWVWVREIMGLELEVGERSREKENPKFRLKESERDCDLNSNISICI